ncbi:unnamed protein product [Blepharisma stoltei]|uniref:Uncharacterized protein n=1 Tax=Blepharisma stoltei TaxID=1481888 RepID=A0AAU9JUR6_9CILI|nr:unnamed protein product [Blepharisma stoltei]
MALRAALRRTNSGAPLRYKAWMKMLNDKVKTSDDASSVSALGAVCDYYGSSVPKDELQSKNNFEINWDEWSHLVTPGIVSKLREKVEAINKEDYDSSVLANQAVEETEELKSLKSYVYWNGALHLSFVAEMDNLIENISHARPLNDTDLWQYRQMYKYVDCPTRWDHDLGWYLSNNDQVMEDADMTNVFQFQKDLGKVALMRYYYDWVGRHQILCTVGKLSQTEREE